ncbi:hypothetical protein Bbelb_316560 [Branchiostoma belcheri]|nr:hypothetical protein Bbelb_316560 [Branchiostoma belcheri]
MAVHEAGVGEEDCRPVFLILGNVVNRDRGDRFLSEEEIFSAVASTLGQNNPAPEPIKCIQISRGLCRIYIQGKACRTRALTKGLLLRGKTITLHEKNPFVKFPRGTRLTVKGLPWSVHDSVIKQSLEQNYGCEITEIQHCHIRVNGRLTDCCNGDRFVFVTKVRKPIPNYNVQMGKFRVNIFYKQSDMMRLEPVEQEEVEHTTLVSQMINSQEEFPPLEQRAYVTADSSQYAEEEPTQTESEDSAQEDTMNRNSSLSAKSQQESTENEILNSNTTHDTTPKHIESGLRSIRERSSTRNTASNSSTSTRHVDANPVDANPVESSTNRRRQSKPRRNTNAAPGQTRPNQYSRDGGHNLEEMQTMSDCN